jgi:outer membrane immunogenic protein
MFRCVTLAAAALLFLTQTSSVSAGGRAGSGPVSWSGIYLGVHAGYGWAELSIADGGTPLGNPPFGAFSCGPALTGNYCNTPLDFGAHGLLGGAHIGFNWQTGNIVLGIEGELGRLDVDADKTLFRPFNDQDFGAVQFDWYATLTGRLGYSTDRALYYVKGGFAFARAEFTAADIDSSAIYAGSLVQSSELLRGWALGAGWEYAISRQLSLKVEYLYMDFASETARSPDGDIYEHDAKLHTVKLGLSFRLPP